MSPRRPLLDGVEERQALIAGSLLPDRRTTRRRSDSIMCRLLAMSPRSIRLESSTSCGGGQQRMPSDLAQEELERVRRSLERRRRRGRGRRRDLALLLVHLEQLDRRAPRTSGTRSRARARRARTARRSRGSSARANGPATRRRTSSSRVERPRTVRRLSTQSRAIACFPTCLETREPAPCRRSKHFAHEKVECLAEEKRPRRLLPLSVRSLPQAPSRCTIPLSCPQHGKTCADVEI